MQLSPSGLGAIIAPAFRRSYDLTRKPKPYRITYALDLFNGPGARESSRKVLGLMLKLLVDINIEFLQKNPNAPRIYRSPVRYMEEPPGQEDWQDIPTTLALGIADCEDLACWRTAEIIVRDHQWAVPGIKEQIRPDGSTLYHIAVLKADGSVEDPSYILGMR